MSEPGSPESKNLPDLATLRRPDPARSAPPARPRRRWTRVLLAVLILASAALLIEPIIDRWLPRTSVVVVSPIAVELGSGAGAGNASSRVVTEAPGWLEPDPGTIAIAPLTPGHVTSIAVESGDRVVRDQELGRIDPRSAQLEVQLATADLREAEAHLARVEAECEIQREQAAQAIELRTLAAAAQFASAAAQRDVEASDAELEDARARAELAKITLDREIELGTKGLADAKRIDIARADLTRALAAITAAVAQRASAHERAQQHAELAKGAHAKLEARAELAIALGRAENDLVAASAELARATARERHATDVLASCVLRAPIDGAIHSLPARRGEWLAEDTPFALMFDPTRMRARVDVPLLMISQVVVGARAELVPEGGTQTYRGKVTGIAAEADPQKVTFRVRVAIEDATPDLIPERLCRVRIFGTAQGGGTSVGARSAMRIPSAALRGNQVLVIGRDGNTAESRTVVVLRAEAESTVIGDGLDPFDRVILDASIAPGTRVEVEERR